MFEPNRTEILNTIALFIAPRQYLRPQSIDAVATSVSMHVNHIDSPTETEICIPTMTPSGTPPSRPGNSSATQRRFSLSLKKGKQQSITSFFTSASRQPTKTPPPKPVQPAPVKPAHNATPSTTVSPASSVRQHARPSANSLTATPVATRARAQPPAAACPAPPPPHSHALRRTLFLDDADEEPPVIRKRRRLVRCDDDDDDGDDGDDDHSPPVNVNLPADAPKKSLRPSEPSAVDTPMRDVQQSRSVFNKAKSVLPSQPEAAQLSQNATALSDGSLATAMFALRRANNGSIPDLPTELSAPAVQKHRNAVRKKLLDLSGASTVGQNQNGWCEKHPWTLNIRDSKQRYPSDPNYDKSTLYVPPHELSDRKHDGSTLTPFQKQFWEVKMDYYDVVIFFKKGKFYEMYDIDADISNTVLGLNYTKGGRVDMRCCGVPEQAFDKHCARLIDLGYKVGRVEQTETANAAEKRKASSGASSSVCKRTLVRVLTKATVREEGILRDHRARYAVAICEGAVFNAPQSDSDQSTVIDDGRDAMLTDSVTIGICYVNVASGSINISQFKDDFRLARLERLITCLAPHQLVVDFSKCSERLSNIARWTSRQLGAAVEDIGLKGGFKCVGSKLSSYLKHDASSPESVKLAQRVRAHLERYEVSSRSFGGLVAHLKYLKVDVETLSLANYTLFPNVEGECKPGNAVEDEAAVPPLPIESSKILRMDASALQNLEILTSCMGTENGSLLSFVDRAHTPAGRRLIRKWLAEPLASSTEIEDRLQAVEDLHAIEDWDGGRLLTRLAKQLRTKKDLERALPKLHQFVTVFDGAVMFDDTNKRRVKEFVQVLRSVQDCVNVLESLAEMMENTSPKSARLKWLCCSGGGVPVDVLDKLKYFLGEAFSLESAENDGEMIPQEGAVPCFDEARGALQAVDTALDAELNKWRGRLRDRSIKFYHRGKEPYQLEVKNETMRNSTPDEFDVVSESKNAKRFYTKRIRKLVRERLEASEAFDVESGSVARHMVAKFDEHYSTWSAVAQACAEVDALIGLAEASRDDGSGPMARPKILRNDHDHATFEAQALRHPILARNCTSFVSNSVSLGHDGETDVMILTGPNAGGKSTLARQVGVATVLAQIGCFVPAESLTIRPFDDLFVRMGASDELARGRSTFMVEMEEVGHMLNNADSRSLIIADEVGRGTSTHDGHAIACATVDHICGTNKAVTIFSTHYSHLADDVSKMNFNAKDAEKRLRTGVYEMAAAVNETSKDITFLYKLQAGASSHSRGVYCARVAGIKRSVADAAEVAAQRLHESLRDKDAVHRVMGLLNALKMDDASVIHTLRNKSLLRTGM